MLSRGEPPKEEERHDHTDQAAADPIPHAELTERRVALSFQLVDSALEFDHTGIAGIRPVHIGVCATALRPLIRLTAGTRVVRTEGLKQLVGPSRNSTGRAVSTGSWRDPPRGSRACARVARPEDRASEAAESRSLRAR